MSKGKSFLKDKVISLRRDGYSYELIKQKTGVSKSTLSNWLTGLQYKPNKEVEERMKRGQLKSLETLRNLRTLRINKASEIASRELGMLSKRDLMLLGIGLYIGEGAKSDKGSIQFSNSDPKVIKIMVRWFTEVLGLNISNLYLRLHLYPDNEIQKSLRFWSHVTGASMDQFGKPYIDDRLKKAAKNKRKLPYGTLHIRIRGLGEKFARVGLYQKILAWIDQIEKHDFAGIV